MPRFAERARDIALDSLGCVAGSRRLGFYRLDLTSLPSEAAEDEPLRAVSVAEAISWEDYRDGWFTTEEVLQRLAGGAQLFALTRNGIDVSFGWLERRRAEIGWVRLPLTLPENVIYYTGLYTPCRYRGQGFGRALCLSLARRSRSLGADWTLCVIDPANPASVNLHVGINFRLYQRLEYRRVFFENRYRVADARGDREYSWQGFGRGPSNLWRRCWTASTGAHVRPG